MIVGIGCDIVNAEVAKSLGWDKQNFFDLRIFTNGEFTLFRRDRKLTFLMGRFAVKEAVVKCLGTGFIDGISPSDIEILQNEFGKPQLLLKNQIKIISENFNITKWHISISHANEYSVAFVVAERSII